METQVDESMTPAEEQRDLSFRSLLQSYRDGWSVAKASGLRARYVWALLRVAVPHIILNKITALSLLTGLGVGCAVAIGQSWSIGFHPAWKLYGNWWIASPLLIPALAALLTLAVLGENGIEWAISKLRRPYSRWMTAVVMIAGVTFGLVQLGINVARQDNPLLGSQPTNMNVLSDSVSEQKQVLGKVSDSGKALLAQLTATQLELDSAKKQLAETLANFDRQRTAAGQVSEELKKIEGRQQQIALKTSELERILEGHQPITLEDLRRSNNVSLVYGLIIGFITSLLATFAYNSFRRNKPDGGSLLGIGKN
jgi:hypothetical protein